MHSTTLLLLFSAGVALSSPIFSKLVPSSGKRSVGYYPNWDIYARGYTVSDIPVENLSHIVYSFMDVDNTTGEVLLSDTWADLEITSLYPSNVTYPTNTTNLYGNCKAMYLLKKANRSLKTMYSIGGWGYSPNFVPVLADATMRATLAKTAVKHMANLGFDGINIDYEYVTTAKEATEVVDLLRLLRSEMDAYATSTSSHPFTLSYATSAGPLKYELLDIAGMDQYLDFWDFMGFDYAGAWDTISGHSSNLYPSVENPASTPFNTSEALGYYFAAGVDRSKMNLGNPLYGHAFNQTAGPGTNFTNVGTASSWGQAGAWDYKDLPLDTSSTEVVELLDIGASYSYDNVAKYMVSYDTPAVARVKAEYVVCERMGGSMWWELSGDKKGEESLVGTTVDVFGKLDSSKNHLDYPQSEYYNLRNGMPGE